MKTGAAMREPSINIERCLEYYLLKYLSPDRALHTATFGECAYKETLRRHSEFFDIAADRFEEGALKGIEPGYDLIYLGGDHDFFELTRGIDLARQVLAPNGILVLPFLDVPTTFFCFRYLTSGDNFALHFTMENTAFLSYTPDADYIDQDWKAANLNRQQFPAFDYLRYSVLPAMPIRRSYEGYASSCGEELEHGFMARSGRILSEGHWSRIRFKVRPNSTKRVDIVVEVRCCTPSLPRPITVSLAASDVPLNSCVLTDDAVVALKVSGALATDGVVVLDMTFSDVFFAGEIADVRFEAAPFGRHAIELISVSIFEAALPAPPRTIRHHDGKVASVLHEGQHFRFFVDNPHDSIQAHHLVGEFYEHEELTLIGRHVGEGARILDVGANIGNHAVYFERVLKASRVVVIELQDRIIELLRLNASLNHLVRTDLSRLGIGFGASEYSAQLTIQQAFNPAGAQVIPDRTGKYAIRRGDDVLIGEDFELIKIDVEGMECDVIDGLEATILRSRPKLFVEVWQENLQRFNDQMARLGYHKLNEWRRYDVAVNLLMEPDSVAQIG